MGLKQFSASSSNNSASSVPTIVPTNIRLEKGKVLDIFHVKLSMEYTMSSPTIVNIVLGLTNNRLNKKIYSGAIGDFGEMVSRKLWITRKRWRYTAPAEAIDEELELILQKPYTIWDSATFVYVIGGGNHTINFADCEILGEIRTASQEEINALQDSQRPSESLM